MPKPTLHNSEVKIIRAYTLFDRNSTRVSPQFRNLSRFRTFPVPHPGSIQENESLPNIAQTSLREIFARFAICVSNMKLPAEIMYPQAVDKVTSFASCNTNVPKNKNDEDGTEATLKSAGYESSHRRRDSVDSELASNNDEIFLVEKNVQFSPDTEVIGIFLHRSEGCASMWYSEREIQRFQKAVSWKQEPCDPKSNQARKMYPGCFPCTMYTVMFPNR